MIESDSVEKQTSLQPTSDSPIVGPSDSHAWQQSPRVTIASGEKTKARDLLAVIRTLKAVESENRSATGEERNKLAQFAGFGAVALSIFPDPVTGHYKNPSWRVLGEELRALLKDDEYDSAKRTTFNAFYTSPNLVTSCRS